MFTGLSCELRVHDSRLRLNQNLSQLYLSRLSLDKPATLNFFKTPASVYREVWREKCVNRLLIHCVEKLVRAFSSFSWCSQDHPDNIELEKFDNIRSLGRIIKKIKNMEIMSQEVNFYLFPLASLKIFLRPVRSGKTI